METIIYSVLITFAVCLIIGSLFCLRIEKERKREKTLNSLVISFLDLYQKNRLDSLKLFDKILKARVEIFIPDFKEKVIEAYQEKFVLARSDLKNSWQETGEVFTNIIKQELLSTDFSLVCIKEKYLTEAVSQLDNPLKAELLVSLTKDLVLEDSLEEKDALLFQKKNLLESLCARPFWTKMSSELTSDIDKLSKVAARGFGNNEDKKIIFLAEIIKIKN